MAPGKLEPPIPYMVFRIRYLDKQKRSQKGRFPIEPLAGLNGVIVGAGWSREGGHGVYGTGFAGVRGASPLPQRPR